ncbi:ABC transporter ATP-binding protein [Pseudoclavibacter endophyticus]|uniref:ABC transporter ATP-binding protein n=1 Tax=Pseudoclavibacter endophyticus TaxID=1778590 RepID=A0A6H9WA59_9MICO|nr:ABC transporter ATP-binding protein [Pseudoclavibacter endophyticus]KAB1646697.1 ABC transporter ATP-binding protein [Pseudoclavibacter endophyticus]GGA76322.1 ABC transporter ATP-binding protein [Pseudoclavibacter endophyticus]
MNDAKVRLSGVTKRFAGAQDVTALEDISLEIAESEFVAIVGPSGCGKSTLLRLVAGLQDPTSGSVEIQASRPGRPKTAMVFQEHALFPWLSVRDNVAFGPRNREVPRKEAAQIADEQLARLGLGRFGDFYPHQLSGGMKQRVGIARALAQDAEILLMDEPLGALDAQTRTLLQEQILELRQESRPTVMYVTHAIDEAVFLSDRVVLMSARPGRVRDIVELDFPVDRGPDLRGTEEFAKVSQGIWNHLRDEVQAAMTGGEQ